MNEMHVYVRRCCIVVYVYIVLIIVSICIYLGRSVRAHPAVRRLLRPAHRQHTQPGLPGCCGQSRYTIYTHKAYIHVYTRDCHVRYTPLYYMILIFVYVTYICIYTLYRYLCLNRCGLCTRRRLPHDHRRRCHHPRSLW